MSSKWVVDVEAVLDIGLEVALSDFHWPVPHDRYESISKDILRLLQRQYESLENDAELKTLLSLAVLDLANECNYLLACLVDVTHAQQSGVRLVYSDGSVLYPMVDQNRFYQRFAGQERTLRSYGSKSVPTLKQRLAGQVHDLRFRFKAAMTSPDMYYVGPNQLLRQWNNGRASSLERLDANFRRFRSLASSLPSTVAAFCDHLANGVSRILSDGGCDVTEEAREYVRHLTRFFLGTAWAQLSYPFQSYVRFEGSRLLVGTGGHFGSRLISHAFQRYGRPVFRFTHGGDRGLFDDLDWGLIELSFTDVYVAHGVGEAARMRERLDASHLPRMLSTRPKIVAIGSDHHEAIYSVYRAGQPAKSPRRVMLATGALDGENRSISLSKVHDLVYLDWWVRLLTALKGLGYHVIAKRHPKGRLSKKPLLGRYCDDEIIGGRLPDMLEGADAYVFDTAGGAFMEALCTMRQVVLIDFGIRPFNPLARRDLAKCCQIVPASIDEDNRIVVDFKSVIDAIETPVDLDARRAFVEEYLLQPSPNLADVLESLAAS